MTPHDVAWTQRHLKNDEKFRDLNHESQKAPVPYPTVFHSEQKCAHFCAEWNLVGYKTGSFWDLWNWSIGRLSFLHVYFRINEIMGIIKNESCLNVGFVVTGDPGGCRIYILRQWWLIWHHGYSQFSVSTRICFRRALRNLVSFYISKKTRILKWKIPFRAFFSVIVLTHWGRDKMAAVSQLMFTNAFFNEN